MTESIILGAVAYDPKVVTIWEGFKAFFEKHGLAFDYVLYSNYESQVRGHWAGQCNVAWNSPLAWVESERLAAQHGRRASAIAMRDTDLDLASVVVVRSGSGINSVAGLKGRRVATGAADSPQSTLIPLELLAQEGLLPGQDFELIRFDVGLGKHGDHVGGERDAAKALMAGAADACCILDANRLRFAQEGTLADRRDQGADRNRAFRPLQFHHLRRRAGSTDPPLHRAAAGHALRRSGRAAAAGAGRAAALAAGAGERLRAAQPRR